MRWMYLAWGVNPYPANGGDVAANYASTKSEYNPDGPDLAYVANDTPGMAPQPGDVLSYSNGHTSVVTSSIVDRNGDGTVKVIQENASTDGWGRLAVSDWHVSATVTGWLNNDGATPPPTSPDRLGYWLLGRDGAVYAFGDARYFASTSSGTHIEPTPSGDGYWVLDSAGDVRNFGDARYLGSPALQPGESAVSLSSGPGGDGYWVFTDRGRAIAFGTAVSYGDVSGRRLNAPVLESVVTPTGRGYYMVASDGGIFAFGDAVFHGSMGGTHLNAPVVGLAPEPFGAGYWLVASDGGIFTFGDAVFHGSMGGTHLNKPVIGVASYGDGYLLAASDGGLRLLRQAVPRLARLPVAGQRRRRHSAPEPMKRALRTRRLGSLPLRHREDRSSTSERLTGACESPTLHFCAPRRRRLCRSP